MHVLAFLAIEAEEPECRVDRDCPPQLTCMSESCQNPCRVTNPCSRSQQCVVTDTRSAIRSVACICPEGTLAGYGGTCESGKFFLLLFCSQMHVECYFFLIVDAKPQCESDFDCQFDQKCSQGNCVPACSLVSCGLNALCLPKNHRGVCECIPGYFGNPSIACNKGMFCIYYIIFYSNTIFYKLHPCRTCDTSSCCERLFV